MQLLVRAFCVLLFFILFMLRNCMRNVSEIRDEGPEFKFWSKFFLEVHWFIFTSLEIVRYSLFDGNSFVRNSGRSYLYFESSTLFINLHESTSEYAQEFRHFPHRMILFRPNAIKPFCHSITLLFWLILCKAVLLSNVLHAVCNTNKV